MDDCSSSTPQPEIEDVEDPEIEDPEIDASIKPEEPVETTELHDLPDQYDPPELINFDGANDIPNQTQQLNGSVGPAPGGRVGVDVAPEPEPRIPAKKDATLREFLGKMDDYAPIIPDVVTNYYLTLAGLPPPPQTPPHLARLLALATQKFVADIAADAYQYARIRSSHTTSNTAAANMQTGAAIGPGAGGGGAGGGGPGGGPGGKEQGGKGGAGLGVQRAGFGGGGQGGGQGRTVLTMEDLGMAVGEYGVNVKRGEFYR